MSLDGLLVAPEEVAGRAPRRRSYPLSPSPGGETRRDMPEPTLRPGRKLPQDNRVERQPAPLPHQGFASKWEKGNRDSG